MESVGPQVRPASPGHSSATDFPHRIDTDASVSAIRILTSNLSSSYSPLYLQGRNLFPWILVSNTSVLWPKPSLNPLELWLLPWSYSFPTPLDSWHLWINCSLEQPFSLSPHSRGRPEDELSPVDSLTWLKLRRGDHQPEDGQGRWLREKDAKIAVMGQKFLLCPWAAGTHCGGLNKDCHLCKPCW